jgi:hypothetical protein
MGATKLRRSSSKSKGPEGILAKAARTVGHAAGQAAKAMGLDHADSSAHDPAKPAAGRPKRASARVQRKNQAEKAKAAAEALLSKSSKDLGAPYRRVMGKPTGNWTNKDIEYVNGLIAKQGG